MLMFGEDEERKRGRAARGRSGRMLKDGLLASVLRTVEACIPTYLYLPTYLT